MMKKRMKKITEPTLLESEDLTAFIAFRDNILPTDEERLKLARAFGVDPGQLDFDLKSFPHPHRSADVGAHQKFMEV